MANHNRYDAKLIGQRIREERKRAGFKSATSLALALYLGRSKVEQFEQGKCIPDYDTLVKMGNLFNCEVGYILGEYPYRTRKLTDIGEATGLSDTAVDTLCKISEEKNDATKRKYALWKLGVLEGILKEPDFLLGLATLAREYFNAATHQESGLLCEGSENIYIEDSKGLREYLSFKCALRVTELFEKHLDKQYFVEE